MTLRSSGERELPRTDGGPLILIVDDDRDSRETARMVLEEEGYSVDVAANGRAALEWLRASPPPTLILVDLMMPVMDGPALLSELEGSADFARIPVILMTAAGPDPRTSGLRYPLLRKPFHLDELMRIVTECAPRLWDDEEPTEPTEEVSVVGDYAASMIIARADATPKVHCRVCDRVANTRCVGCGEAFCRPCIDAGPDGRCAECWRAAHR